MNHAAVSTLSRESGEAKSGSPSGSRPTAKTRVQLDLTPRALKLLNELKDKTEAASYAEVLKNALKLYDGLIAEAERGSEFLIRDKDGNVSTLKVFL